jgi:hypothetical protein
MIIVRIVGGLASQLHKYALGRALALRLGTELKLDIEWFKNPPPSDTPWQFQLEKFKLNFNCATPLEVRQVRGHPFWNRIVRWFNRRFKFLFLRSREVNIGSVTPEQWMKLPDNTYLYGEAFGDTLIRSIRPMLLQEFQLREPLSSEALKYVDLIKATDYAVSLHVRRGDFIFNATAAKFHAHTELDYYFHAVAVVLRNHINAQFFLFADDPDWVAVHLLPGLPAGSVIVNSLSNEEDFVLMSLCCGNIISNSGFSWTAAWLNTSPCRLVISPKLWFKDEDLNALAMKAMHQPDWIYL